MLTGTRLRVAVVFPDRLEPFHWDKDPGLIAMALAELGNDVLFVCADHAPAGGFALGGVTLVRESALADPSAWSAFELDAAIVYSWLGFPEILGAIRQTGARVVAKADSDGLVSPRYHARAQLRRMTAGGSAGDRLRNAAFWARRYAWLYRAEHARFVAAFEAADATVLETTVARATYVELLRRLGVASPEDRVASIPNPIADIFLEEPIVPKRAKVVAIGRWADAQKGAGALARAFARLNAPAGTAEFAVLGPDGGTAFSSISTDRTVRIVGPVPPAQVAAELASASCIAFSSRWEGSSLAGNEALAMGCTVVGPPIPSVIGAVEDGRFGTVARSRSPRDLADALRTELARWERGERDAGDISTVWRSRVDAKVVATQLLQLARRDSAAENPDERELA